MKPETIKPIIQHKDVRYAVVVPKLAKNMEALARHLDVNKPVDRNKAFNDLKGTPSPANILVQFKRLLKGLQLEAVERAAVNNKENKNEKEEAQVEQNNRYLSWYQGMVAPTVESVYLDDIGAGSILKAQSPGNSSEPYNFEEEAETDVFEGTIETMISHFNVINGINSEIFAVAKKITLEEIGKKLPVSCSLVDHLEKMIKELTNANSKPSFFNKDGQEPLDNKFLSQKIEDLSKLRADTIYSLNEAIRPNENNKKDLNMVDMDAKIARETLKSLKDFLPDNIKNGPMETNKIGVWRMIVNAFKKLINYIKHLFVDKKPQETIGDTWNDLNEKINKVEAQLNKTEAPLTPDQKLK